MSVKRERVKGQEEEVMMNEVRLPEQAQNQEHVKSDQP